MSDPTTPTDAIPEALFEPLNRWADAKGRAEAHDLDDLATRLLSDFRYDTLLNHVADLRHRTTGANPDMTKAAIEVVAHTAAAESLEEILALVDALKAARPEQ